MAGHTHSARWSFAAAKFQSISNGPECLPARRSRTYSFAALPGEGRHSTSMENAPNRALICIWYTRRHLGINHLSELPQPLEISHASPTIYSIRHAFFHLSLKGMFTSSAGATSANDYWSANFSALLENWSTARPVSRPRPQCTRRAGLRAPPSARSGAPSAQLRSPRMGVMAELRAKRPCSRFPAKAPTPLAHPVSPTGKAAGADCALRPSPKE